MQYFLQFSMITRICLRIIMKFILAKNGIDAMNKNYTWDEKYSTVFETLLITNLYFVLNTYNFFSFQYSMNMAVFVHAKINYFIFDFMMFDMHASDTSILCWARFNQFSINYKTMGHYDGFFSIFSNNPYRVNDIYQAPYNMAECKLWVAKSEFHLKSIWITVQHTRFSISQHAFNDLLYIYNI